MVSITGLVVNITGFYNGQRWYTDITDGVLNARAKLKNPLLTKEEWYELKLSECEADLLADCNFLKKAFFEECKNLGIV